MKPVQRSEARQEGPRARSPRRLAEATGLGREEGFRWRGGELSRVEALSDAIFAFAVTLLVVSLEVPETFDQLLRMMRGFPAFGICFALLLLIWYEHYLFFRRYGLDDTVTIVLNGVLLFVVLFYIYPLKFLFSLLVGQLLGLESQGLEHAIAPSQGPALMLIYSLGSLAVFSIFTLLYLHAYRQRGALELTALEVFDTRTRIEYNAIFVGTALLSIAIVVLGGPAWVGWAGLVYFLLGPACAVQGAVRGRQRRRLAALS